MLHPFEPEMALLPHLVPRDRVAVDVGANMGEYTAAFAEFAKGVVAFEPNPAMAKDLERLLSGRVKVIAAAVSDHPGTAELRIPTTGSGLATIEAQNDLEGASYHTVSTPMVRLDDCDLGDVGFIKIDVEGHELAVLKGAEETLRRCKPVILVEIEDRHRRDAVASAVSHLKTLGYSPWYLRDKALTPLTTQSPPDGVYNYVMLPLAA
jgi:FkbM family methyltransferase